MAKAQFHKNQRVFVKPVGTWAVIERVMPQWTKGLDEPLRIFYDVGLGREFSAEELQAEQIQTLDIAQMPKETWRVVRARNKWQPQEDCQHHPFPGSYPIVMTGEADWGGWRVPGAEYDLNPLRIEAQSRLIATSPKLFAIAAALAEIAARSSGDESQEVIGLAEDARRLIKFIEG